jgi:hypothetical protein
VKPNNIFFQQNNPASQVEFAKAKLPRLTDYFGTMIWSGFKPEQACTCAACRLEAQISHLHAILELEATATEKQESQVA